MIHTRGGGGWSTRLREYYSLYSVLQVLQYHFHNFRTVCYSSKVPYTYSHTVVSISERDSNGTCLQIVDEWLPCEVI